jgi:hypothetical protein
LPVRVGDRGYLIGDPGDRRRPGGCAGLPALHSGADLVVQGGIVEQQEVGVKDGGGFPQLGRASLH